MAVANLTSRALEPTVKPLAAACSDNNLVNSQGMFLGDQPLRFSLPLLLVQVSVILVLSAAAHLVLRRLGQSRFVTHMLVGIFLGPSVLDRSASFRDVLFSERGTYILESVPLVSLILFLFSMGVKTDLSLLRRPSGHAIAVAVGIMGTVVPLAVTLPVFHALQPTLPEDLKGSSLVTELVVRLSLSSFPVIADASFVVVVIVALLSALVTDAIGFKYMIGPMMLGLALPDGMPIGATMTERLDSFFIALFLPVYMALSGYRTDLTEFTRSEASEKWCSSDAANTKVLEPVSRSSTTSAWGTCAESHACTCMRVCGVHLDPKVPRQLKN
ncbi:cation/H(+) antiporter 18-like [Miscanthus floridulus]|uniref:cation/H(+) antiporter 18-like n=1 Tax=Miscanthus floridulus TaxID=154761 RepID=UPI0034580F6A